MTATPTATARPDPGGQGRTPVPATWGGRYRGPLRSARAHDYGTEGRAVKPPFTYFGGKLRIAERIVALLPPHQHYVEPFAGSLAVLLAKPPAVHETVNDLDGDLMNFWRVLRDRPAELQRACALTPHSRGEFSACHDMGGADDLERARRVWVRLTQGRGGSMQRAGWRYYGNPDGQSSPMPDYLQTYVGRAAAAAVRLARVSLECGPAVEVIRRYGQHPGVLIYADPPYLAEVRAPRARYNHEMPVGRHQELLEVLLECRAAVVLSGYASPLYDGMLGGWHRAEIAARADNGTAGERARVEVLWSNRPFPCQISLFDDMETTGPQCPRCTCPTELRGRSRTPYCRNCHQFVQGGTLGDCQYRSDGPSLVELDAYGGYRDEWRQSATACCPRQTIPDSCSCLEGCKCMCTDCDCTGWGEEYEDE